MMKYCQPPRLWECLIADIRKKIIVIVMIEFTFAFTFTLNPPNANGSVLLLKC